ncbi:MAG: hypothetical protein GY719_09730 [bacterium]|nr:hypothetical protein [bacterium]
MGKRLKTMVMKRVGLCDLVVGAATVQGPAIGGGLGEYLSPVLAEGEEMPDLASPITLYSRKLVSYRDAMVKADEEQQAALSRLDEVRKDLAVPEGRLRGDILSLRATCQGLWDDDKVSSLSLDFNVAQEPKPLVRQAEIIRDRLRDPEVELVSVRWVKGPQDGKEWADELDREIEEMRPLLARYIERRKQLDTAQVRKDQAMEEFDVQFIRITRLLEATFRVAGETELADRIRPTVRQLGRDGGQREEPAAAEQPEGASDADAETESVTPEPESGTSGEQSATSAA